MTTPVGELIAFTIDTSDASAAAAFYGRLLGGEVNDYPEYGYAQVVAGAHTLNFQGVESFSAPQWPGQEHPQQFHLDLRVDDVEAAIAAAEKLGARVADEQPSPDAYRVMIDPDGHPFCLCPPAQS